MAGNQRQRPAQRSRITTSLIDLVPFSCSFFIPSPEPWPSMGKGRKYSLDGLRPHPSA
jgi:hypothetical protein